MTRFRYFLALRECPVICTLARRLLAGLALHSVKQWYVGKITDVNRRRTTSDNVEAHFEGGSGQLVCEAAEYGADKAWVLVGEQIEVES